MEKLPVNLKLNYGYPSNSYPSTGSNSSEEAQFPTLHYEGSDDLDLPQDGTMTVRYHVKRETNEVDRKTGKHHYCCDIEILSIEKIKGEDPIAPTRSGSESADALDRLMEAHEEGEEGEEGDGEEKGY